MLQKIKSYALFCMILFVGFSLKNRAQNSYTFTPCGATGPTGPTQTQVNNSYSATSLSGLVIVTGGIQSWTVPQSGVYTIDAYGAQGGGLYGGLGARIKGDFMLSAGTVLKILVGQQGLYSSPMTTGGGGAFVASSTGSPIIVAGGGGGASQSGSTQAGANSTSGQVAYGGWPTSGLQSYAPGASGSGGYGSSGGGGGGGGGGFYYNGDSGDSSYGYSFLNGGAGGSGNLSGGFGGGGGARNNSGNYWGGGAGGGYSGGAGACGVPGYAEIAGGGGSCNSGTNQTNIAGFNAGAGKVIITEATGLSITQTTPVICNGQLTAALSATVNGGVAPYTFTWSTGANSSSITNLGAGTYTCWAISASAVTYSGTFTVYQPSAISTGISVQNNLTCNGGSNGYLGVSVFGGAFPYTYTWAPAGGNSSTAFGLTAGSYSCFITDANGCTVVRTATLTQPAAPSIIAFATSSAICMGQSVTLLGGGAVSYTWTNGVLNNVPFSPTVSATYVVTGFNAQGCPGYAQTSVIVNPTPTVIATGGSPVCPGMPVTLSASGANSYSWSSGALSSSAIVTPTITATYTVTGTNTLACSNTATVLVLVYSAPPVYATVSSTAVCSGASVTMTGYGAVSYTWSGGVSNGVPYSPTASSIYTLTGTGVNGCVNSATYAVAVNPLPILSIGGSTVICQGAATTLSVNGATSYTWNTGAQSDSILVSPSATSVYSVIGTSSNGCENTASFNLLVTPLPNVTITSGGNLLCLGNSMTLLAGGASSYTWLPQQVSTVSVSIHPTVTTSYTLVGSNNGCSNTAPLTISVIPLPTLALSGPPAPICAFSAATLSANGAITYSWSSGSSTSSIVITPSVTTVYSVTGTGSNGCKKTDMITVTVKPLPVLSVVNADSVVCSDVSTTLTATGAVSYTWNTLDTTGNIVVTASVNTTYSVIGLGNNGCSSTTEYLLVVSSCSGIHEWEGHSENITIYPNPTNGIVHIKASSDLELLLINNLGDVIKQIDLHQSNNYQVDLSSLSQGVYFIIGEKAGQAVKKKIIITN